MHLSISARQSTRRGPCRSVPVRDRTHLKKINAQFAPRHVVYFQSTDEKIGLVSFVSLFIHTQQWISDIHSFHTKVSIEVWPT